MVLFQITSNSTVAKQKQRTYSPNHGACTICLATSLSTDWHSLKNSKECHVLNRWSSNSSSIHQLRYKDHTKCTLRFLEKQVEAWIHVRPVLFRILILTIMWSIKKEITILILPTISILDLTAVTNVNDPKKTPMHNKTICLQIILYFLRSNTKYEPSYNAVEHILCNFSFLKIKESVSARRFDTRSSQVLTQRRYICGLQSCQLVEPLGIWDLLVDVERY